MVVTGEVTQPLLHAEQLQVGGGQGALGGPERLAFTIEPMLQRQHQGVPLHGDLCWEEARLGETLAGISGGDGGG